MNYKIRIVKPNEVRSALNLALAVFMEFEAPVYSEDGIKRFIDDCIENEEYANTYISSKYFMMGAFGFDENTECDKIIGMIAAKGDNHISMVFVNKNYHRQGVATAIMKEIITTLRLKGADKITVNSSPYGLPFYHVFGFTDTDTEQTKNGLTFTPMVFELKDYIS